MAIARKDRKLLGRSEQAQDIEVVAASGSRIRDARGRTFIDFQMGWCVGNLGWNPPEILARVRAFEGPSYVAPHFLYEPWVELAELLVDNAPGQLARAYRTVGGTESVELAIQLAMKRTGRHKILAIEDAYHGNTFAVHNPKQLAPPLDGKALARLETLLKHREFAAFIMEPIITNLAVTIPDSDFMTELVTLCHKYGTLVIADEVACGFGRAGRVFASELYDLEPDIMCLAKAITSGVAPLGATLATDDVADAIDDLDFYSTFGWHSLAIEAGIATQHFWRDHRDAVLENVAERSAELRGKLSTIEWPREPELRIQGLAIGVGLGDAKYVGQLEAKCREDGLLLFAEDDSLVMFPALTLDHETLQEAIDILSQCAQS